MKPRILFILMSAIALVGCSDSSGAQKPASAAPIVSEAPTKTPSTPEEKIAAIQRSSMPADRKKAAIEKVKSGSL